MWRKIETLNETEWMKCWYGNNSLYCGMHLMPHLSRFQYWRGKKNKQTNHPQWENAKKKKKGKTWHLYICSLSRSHTHENEIRSPNKAQSNQTTNKQKREIANIVVAFEYVCSYKHTHSQTHINIWIKWHGKLYSDILFTFRSLGHDCDTICLYECFRTHKIQ